MKRIERLHLIDRIGRELQNRMSYRDIEIYLAGFGVKTSKVTSSVNSKWVYTKELLADESDELILNVASELDLETPNIKSAAVGTSKFWKPNTYRLFISHISAHKKVCSALATSLSNLNISAFVAHIDIEPTKA